MSHLPPPTIARLAALTLPLALACHAASQKRLDPGILHQRVVCKQDRNKSYALYLPSNHKPRDRRPVLFGFSPSAKGASVVERYQQAAERFGWIVVGSNDSRNGPMEACNEAADAMWTDVLARFRADKDRLYATGMSGGACVAAAFAQRMPAAFAGAFLHVRGDLETAPPEGSSTFCVVATGARDFNFEESIRFVRDVRKTGNRVHLVVHQSGHNWAPPDSCLDMLRYAELLSALADKRAEPQTLIEEELRAIRRDLDGPMFWLAHRRLEELATLVAEGPRSLSTVRRQLEELQLALADRAAQEATAWNALETEGLFDTALLGRYPSPESIARADRARRQLFIDHPGTSAVYAAVLAQRLAPRSLGRVLRSDPAAATQQAYTEYFAKARTFDCDFVAAATELAQKPATHGRALTALFAGFEAGQVDAKTLGHPNFEALREATGFRILTALAATRK